MSTQHEDRLLKFLFDAANEQADDRDALDTFLAEVVAGALVIGRANGLAMTGITQRGLLLAANVGER